MQKNGMPGLSTTLFDRLVGLHGDSISRMLTEQYRMNEAIMQWSSDEFYSGRLTAHTSAAQRLLCELDGVEKMALTKVPLVFIDTCGGEQETVGGDDNLVSRIRARESKSNEGECDIVVKLVEELLGAGVAPGDIGVIAPYSAQVDLLRSLLGESHPLIDVSTVDGFQGREKEAIVISTVRSNDAQDVGFLAERRRMNVAVTRARRLVCLVADSFTLEADKFLDRMVAYFQQHALYLVSEEYLSSGSSGEPAKPVSLERQAKPVKQPVTAVSGKSSAEPLSSVPSAAPDNANGGECGTVDAHAGTNGRPEPSTVGTAPKVILETAKADFEAEAANTETASMEATQANTEAAEDSTEQQATGDKKEAEAEAVVAPKPSVADARALAPKKAPTKAAAPAKKKEEPEVVPGFEVKLPAPAAPPGSRKKKKKKKAETPAPAPAPVSGRTLASASVAEVEAAKVARKVKASNGNDLDALLNEIKVYGLQPSQEPEAAGADQRRDPTKCKFGTCSRPVHLMGTVCKLCSYTYCQRHSLPEVHGCGQAARAAARATLTAPRQLRDKERAELKGELKKKMETAQRAKKKPAAKKKKKGKKR